MHHRAHIGTPGVRSLALLHSKSVLGVTSGCTSLIRPPTGARRACGCSARWHRRCCARCCATRRAALCGATARASPAPARCRARPARAAGAPSGWSAAAAIARPRPSAPAARAAALTAQRRMAQASCLHSASLTASGRSYGGAARPTSLSAALARPCHQLRKVHRHAIFVLTP